MESDDVPTALLLHGWGTAPSRLEKLRTALVRDGLDAHHWAYEPQGSLHALGAALARDVTGPVHLVGHSLGGLVCAAAVLDHGLDALTVTTVNSPWRGTWVAWTAASDDPLGRELRWGSTELARLRERLATHLTSPAGPEWTALAAAGDLAAPPTTAARLPPSPRLTTRTVPVRGHSISLEHPRMIDAIRDRVLQPA